MPERAPELEAEERLEAGTVIDGRYRIGERLGEGAVGAVYYAEHTIVGRACAVKVLSFAWAANRSMASRFRAEARAASAAGHPGIVDVLDAGELGDGRPYLVMEYLAGRDLWGLIESAAPLSVERACRIVRDIARAIEAAHGVGVVHRDLKAENVMVIDRDGEEHIKVLDFGIAAGADASARATAPGTVMGTPAYMAPEQAEGAVASPSFDIYAIGTLLFELLTGRLPFEAESPLKVLAMKTRPAPSVSTFRPELPGSLVALVDSCLARSPEDRPGSAGAIARRLQAILDGSLDEAPLVVQPADLRPPRRALGLAALGLLGLVVTIAMWPDPTPAPAESSTDASAEVKQAATVPLPEASLAPSEESGVEPLEPPLEPPVEPPLAASPPTDPPPDVDEPPAPESKAARSKHPSVAREPEPEPAVAPPIPRTAPQAPRSGPSEAECEQHRTAARRNVEEFLWTAVLQHTREGACWKGDRAERRKLRAKAYLNLREYEQCIQAGKGATDETTLRILETCRVKVAG